MTWVIGRRSRPALRSAHHDRQSSHVPTGGAGHGRQRDDNIFLLLVLGLTVPVVFYTIWGLFEIATIPVAK
jgi:hypothetical protein